MRIVIILAILYLACKNDTSKEAVYLDCLSAFNCGLEWEIVIPNVRNDSIFLLHTSVQGLYRFLMENNSIRNEKDFKAQLEKILNSTEQEQLVHDISKRFNIKIMPYEPIFKDYEINELIKTCFDSNNTLTAAIQKSSALNSLIFELQKKRKLVFTHDMSGQIRHIETRRAGYIIEQCTQNGG